jgi:hypothetical protein
MYLHLFLFFSNDKIPSLIKFIKNGLKRTVEDGHTIGKTNQSKMETNILYYSEKPWRINDKLISQKHDTLLFYEI